MIPSIFDYQSAPLAQPITFVFLHLDYETEYNGEQEEEYYDRGQEYVDPVTVRRPDPVEQLEPSLPNQRFEQAPTDSSVTEFSYGNAVNLRGESVLSLSYLNRGYDKSWCTLTLIFALLVLILKKLSLERTRRDWFKIEMSGIRDRRLILSSG